MDKKGKGKGKKADDWTVVGWVSMTKKGNIITVKSVDDPDDPDSESTLLGFVQPKTLAKMLDGDINGTPIKLPPDFDPDDE